MNQAVVGAQVADALSMVRLAVAANLFVAVVAAATMWPAGWHWVIVAWLVAVFAIGLARLWHSWRCGAKPVAPARVIRVITLFATTNGSIWGGGLAAAALVAAPGQFNLVAMLCGGMMGAPAVTFGPLPRAALAFVVPFSVGAVLACYFARQGAGWSGVFLALSYAFLVCRAVLANTRMFIAKVQSELSLRESAETVQLLLNDYESQSADWLWATAPDGRIKNPPQRFAEVSGRPASELDGTAMTALFDASAERERLAGHIRARTAFRDLALRLTVNGETRWWSLSANPAGDGGLRGVAADVTGQKRAEAHISYMAHYDGLTGLANRFLLNERLRESLRGDGLEQTAVLYLDLDHFKSINDTLGHPVGDRLLCEVARRIEAAVGSQDLVARLGGDEFAVLVNDTPSLPEIVGRAEAIIHAISRPFLLNEMQVMTSTSIGIALSGPAKRDSDTDELLKQADLALYTAKSRGRSRMAFFESRMEEAVRERREMETDLRMALQADAFELHYQPLVSAATGKTVSYEALLRWRHPTRGLISPAAFIPLAEETGLIIPIGEWVLRRAAADLATWPATLGVSVNVSPAQMRSASLVSAVVNAVLAANVDPGRLEIEITESVLMHDSEANLAILHQLHEFGVKIALDDFGTGYSSLNYLRCFPFDKIKIDRCFVEGVEEREDCRAIIRAVTSLADSLGMVTTAEGVENSAQLECLKAEGCTELQGFLFSRPKPACGIDELQDCAPVEICEQVTLRLSDRISIGVEDPLLAVDSQLG